MQSVKSKNGRPDDTLGRNSKSIRPLDKIYRPTDREPFMNERQRAYFRLEAARLAEGHPQGGQGDAGESPQGRQPESSRSRRPRIG